MWMQSLNYYLYLAKKRKKMAGIIDRYIDQKLAERMAEQIEIQSATIILDMIEAIQKNKKLSLNEALEALGKTVEEYERAKQIEGTYQWKPPFCGGLSMAGRAAESISE